MRGLEFGQFPPTVPAGCVRSGPWGGLAILWRFLWRRECRAMRGGLGRKLKRELNPGGLSISGGGGLGDFSYLHGTDFVERFEGGRV